MKKRNHDTSGPVVVNWRPSPISEPDQATLRLLGIVEENNTEKENKEETKNVR